MPSDYFLQHQRCIDNTLSPPAYSYFVPEAIPLEHGLNPCRFLMPHNQMLRCFLRALQPLLMRFAPSYMPPVHPLNNNACHPELAAPLLFRAVPEVFALCTLLARAFARFGTSQKGLKRVS
jgi:hypothetical protein